MKRLEDDSTCPDFACEPSEFDARLDALCRRADARLESLTSDDAFQALRSQIARSNKIAEKNAFVSFVLELGRVRLSLDEASALDVDSIVSLSDAANGAVQIWADGRRCGSGALLVANGKLAVRIDKIEEF